MVQFNTWMKVNLSVHFYVKSSMIFRGFLWASGTTFWGIHIKLQPWGILCGFCHRTWDRVSYDWYARFHTRLYIKHMAGILCGIVEFYVGNYECPHLIFHGEEIHAKHAIEFPLEICLEKLIKWYSNVCAETAAWFHLNFHAGFCIGPSKHFFSF